MKVKSILKNVQHFFLPIAVVLIFASFLFPKNPLLQFQLLMIAVFCYIGLTLTHHYLDKSLTLQTFIEYILIALLALMVLAGILI